MAGKRQTTHPEHGHTAEELARVHVTRERVAALTLTPPHAPRVETALFRETRHRLIVEEDQACWVCRVRASDLADPLRRVDPAINPMGAVSMECHHAHIERSLANGIDRDLLALDYPSVLQFATVEEWADSIDNNQAFCNQCHRLAAHSVHSAVWPVVQAQRYARRDPLTGKPYLFAARTPYQAQRAMVADESVLRVEDHEDAARETLSMPVVPSSQGAAAVAVGGGGTGGVSDAAD